MNSCNSPNTQNQKGFWWLCCAALSRSWFADQSPNAALNIWVNIHTQNQTKLLGDWEELHQKSQATAVYFHFYDKGASGPINQIKSNSKSELIIIIGLLSTENRPSEVKQNVVLFQQ